MIPRRRRTTTDRMLSKFGVRLTKSDKERLGGLKDMAEIVAKRNPVVATASTLKDSYSATHRVVYGKKKRIKVGSKLYIV